MIEIIKFKNGEYAIRRRTMFFWYEYLDMSFGYIQWLSEIDEECRGSLIECECNLKDYLKEKEVIRNHNKIILKKSYP